MSQYNFPVKQSPSDRIYILNNRQTAQCMGNEAILHFKKY